MATKAHVLAIYRKLLRESSKFDSYNYRLYALRRVKDAFHEHKAETDPQKLNSLLQKAEANLEIIKRQVILGQLYSQQKLVIEKNK